MITTEDNWDSILSRILWETMQNALQIYLPKAMSLGIYVFIPHWLRERELHHTSMLCHSLAEWAAAAQELCSCHIKITAHRAAPRPGTSPVTTYHSPLNQRIWWAKRLRRRNRGSAETQSETLSEHIHISATAAPEIQDNLAQDQKTPAMIPKISPIHLTFTEHQLQRTNSIGDMDISTTHHSASAFLALTF